MRFKYSCFFVITLMVTGKVYATESLPTQGPSVGHRPVVTGLILGTGTGPGNGIITDSTVKLSVGSTIGLLSAAGGPGGMDIDGDEDKAGAYCVWYKIPAGGGTPIVIQDRGPADRNCQYTVQMSDAGFKIKVDVTIFSDTDKALAKGYTLNPVASMPVEQISANEVVAPYLKGLFIEKNNLGSEFTFNESDGFPTIAFKGATFKVLIDDGVGNLINGQYSWSSSRKNEVSVNNDGEVTFDTKPSGSVIIEARSRNGGGVIKYEFKTKYWMDIYTGPTGVYAPDGYQHLINSCVNDGRKAIPKELYTTVKMPGENPVRGIGTLFGEWGSGGKSDPYKTIHYQPWVDSYILYTYHSGMLRSVPAGYPGWGGCYDTLP